MKPKTSQSGGLLARLWVLPLLLLLACDGGTRGSGINGGFSTLTGSLAPSTSSTAAALFGRAAVTPTASQVLVQVREAPGIEAVVDPLTLSFTLSGVPAGDVTLDFISDTTSTLVLYGVPEGVSLHMVNVRFENGVAKPAGFGITPDEGNGATVETSTRKGAAPLDVTFNVADLSVPSPAQVVWDFGDGIRSGRPSTSHVYDEPGNYVVEATASNGDNKQRAFQVIQVSAPGERNLEVTASADQDRGLPPLSVLFTAEAENNVGNVTYLWDFGDTSVPGEGAQVRHLYTDQGLFLAQVTAFDEAGNEATDVVQVEVDDGTRPVPLTVKAEVDVPVGPAPLRVQLHAIITGSGPVSVLWDFDDGTATSNLPSPSHTYATPGTYFATVTVTELSSGKSVHDQVAIEVQ